MPRLTRQEWDAIAPPFCWLHLNAPATWTSTHLAMVGKWLSANLGGWWFSDLEPSGPDRRITLVFERPADRVLFKLWVSDDPFARQGGDIEAVGD